MNKQISLRTLQPNDEEALYLLVKENQAQFIQWLDWAAMIQNHADFTQFFSLLSISDERTLNGSSSDLLQKSSYWYC